MAWSILLPFCCSKSPMSYESEYSTSLCLVLFFTRHVQTPSSSRDPHLLPTVPRWCWTDYPSSWLVRAFPSYKLQPGIWAHVLLLFRPWKLALWMITLVELRKFHINKQGANFISFQFKRLKKKHRDFEMDWIRLLICVENDCVAFALKLILLWIQFVALGICYAYAKCSVWFLFSSFLWNLYFWNKLS